MAARLLADAKVDAICRNEVRGGWLGYGHDEGLCAAIQAETGIRTTTSVLALKSILRSLRVISFGLVTPFKKERNEMTRASYGANGVDFNDTWERHLGLTDNIEIGKLDEATLAGMGLDVAANGAHVLSTFCTNFRAAQRVEHWEKSMSVTVLDTVSTVVWGCCKL